MATRRQDDRKRNNGAGGPPDEFVSALLRNPTRNRIVHLLEGNPGMNKSQLARKLGVSIGSVSFHLNRLGEAGLVETRPGRGRQTICFTSKNAGLWEESSLRALFGMGTYRELALFFARNPGSGAQEAADALGCSLHAVRRQIRSLEKEKVVQRLRVERDVIYHAPADLVAWIEGQEWDAERKWPIDLQAK